MKTAFSGVGIGTIASLAGVGGGSLTVPFLNRHGIEMRKAVGTSSVCAFAIAVSGMLSFTLHGYHATGLPKWSFGYVYLPALLSITITSVFTTKIGVRLAVGLPTKTLKKNICHLFDDCGRNYVAVNSSHYNYRNKQE